MLQYLADSPLWLKIILGILSLPLVCLLVGILVCLVDPDSVGESDKIMELGAMATGIFALLGISALGIRWLKGYWFGFGNFAEDYSISLIISVVLMFVGFIGLAFLSERNTPSSP